MTNEQKAAIKHQLSWDWGAEIAESIAETVIEAIEADEEKQQAIEDGLELPEIDHFGGCPKCALNDGYLNIGRGHWFICHKHKNKWFVGSNLFSSWRHEPEEEWERNAQLIERYREVEPLSSYFEPYGEPLEIELPPEFFDDDLPL